MGLLNFSLTALTLVFHLLSSIKYGIFSKVIFSIQKMTPNEGYSLSISIGNQGIKI